MHERWTVPTAAVSVFVLCKPTYVNKTHRGVKENCVISFTAYVLRYYNGSESSLLRHRQFTDL
jgi:hypothetical protein